MIFFYLLEVIPVYFSCDIFDFFLPLSYPLYRFTSECILIHMKMCDIW